MAVWNYTDVPLAYLITFRSYGTWLHGDERGSVDRSHNRYGFPYIPANPQWEDYKRKALKSPPVKLRAKQRRSIEFAIRETCERRKWLLYAFNIRTNHVHSVVAIGDKKPEIALNAFKANATRQMRADGCLSSSRSPWWIKAANADCGMSKVCSARSIT